MDFGIITFVYIIIGVIFVLAKAIRTKFFEKGQPLTANQAPESLRTHQIPPVFLKSSFIDPDEPVDAGLYMPAKLQDGDLVFMQCNLRSAVVYSVILERKYV